MKRDIRDYIEKLTKISEIYKKLSFSDTISYDKAIELREEYDKITKKLIFYKKLQKSFEEIKRR
jgi:hypothetical protein